MNRISNGCRPGHEQETRNTRNATAPPRRVPSGRVIKAAEERRARWKMQADAAAAATNGCSMTV